MIYTTDGLVLRSKDWENSGKLLTILTPERGQVAVIAKGASSMHSKLLPLVQPYVYGNFEIYQKNGSLGWLRGGSVTQPLYGLSRDLDRLSLSAYLSEVALDTTGEDEPAVDVLRLILNALYALSEDKYPAWIIKGAFEWRVAALSGFLPDLGGCHVCGGAPGGDFYLDVMNGCLICSDCLNKQGMVKGSRVYDDLDGERSLLLPISPAVVAACRYILCARVERVFAFSLEESERDIFASVCENYLLHHLERDFDSLQFYKSLVAGGL